MQKRTVIEGSSPSKIIQMMRKYGENKDMSIDLGTVKSPPPNLKIQLDADGLMLEKGDLIIAEHLTEYKRKYSVQGGTVSGSAGLNQLTSLSVTNGEITFYNELRAGDKVIVIGDNDTQFYYVVDKAVIY